ncbi:MFS general substrate transporter [Lentithecium fluviatile CBS 122367]|uniref:MFS general substrate transporter n=1 Tax=Lentithecium fluviatile CBS 122367 TaxID=1168545 RepID=A0A6G1IYJ3_9PLEO|nr:MFS general substrate transporter [Lentithecium fluviatile CBS 122367]
MVSRGADAHHEETPLLIDATVPSTPSTALHPTSGHDLVDQEAGQASGSDDRARANVSVLQIVLVLLIGVFISNADGSLLMATHPIIASEFNDLRDSSWLLTSFGLAAAAMQPLYGKLSDIYGRKALILLAYTLFGGGCALVGVGTSMGYLILGRVVSGLGSSGMTALVSILITDLVPLRDVASWRSYVNIVATTGRSIGGPLGGWLADTVGWRWSFLGQAPLAGVAIILIAITLPAHTTQEPIDELKKSNLARIDVLGATFMVLTILSFLFPLEIGGDRLPWSHPVVLGLLGGACLFGALFVVTEARFAKEPIIPLILFRHKDVVLSLVIMICQTAAQVGLMIAIPLYFQVTSSASNTVAGAHLFPAVAGNAVGGILSGIVIKRTGRYKTLSLLALFTASIGYLLLILRWHGNTNWLESLYIFPGGFAMGVIQSTLFINVQAAIDPAHSAVAASSLYLASSVGMLIGMAGTSSVLQSTLKGALERKLTDAGFADKEKWKIIGRAISDVHYADHAKPSVGKLVIRSYVEALNWTHVFSLACSLTAFFVSIFLRQHKL